jgi:hypothetical protein
VTKYKHEQRTFLIRLSSEATESCIERSRGRGMYSQASSIIIITSNGGGYCRSMSRHFLHRQDLRYVQSITCSMYDIMTFLMARKKLSHFHSDLCYAMNAKHLPPTSAQGNATPMLQIALSLSGATALNRSKFCNRRRQNFGYNAPSNARANDV